MTQVRVMTVLRGCPALLGGWVDGGGMDPTGPERARTGACRTTVVGDGQAVEVPGIGGAREPRGRTTSCFCGLTRTAGRDASEVTSDLNVSGRRRWYLRIGEWVGFESAAQRSPSATPARQVHA